MKSLRKSLNGHRDSASRPNISTPTPLPPVSKPPSAILPPQKVIRALSPYKSQAPQELSFSKGDFFYVLKDADSAAWYEAHNPVTGARGLVPRALFEEFGKNAPNSRASQPPAQFSRPPVSPRSESSAAIPKAQVFYAIVLHDFTAERADELDAKRGDAITVVAQSNREWFVAKPIGRLGRPGLIPVSFVEIHDPATGKSIPDINALMDSGDLPKVEDWKRAMLAYKQNSIALGVIDAPPSKDPVTTSPYTSQYIPPAQNTPQQPPPRSHSPDLLPEGILLSADVVSFHFEMEDYWFRIDATYQPYSRPGQSQLPPSKNLILFRQYNDFYDFQVSLLDTFPREAGREPPEPRTLPYMPGPANEVDDQLTATRRVELNEYIHSLCQLGVTGGRYILEHIVVRRFLSLKPGDVENEGDPRVDEIEALFAQERELEQATGDDYDRDGMHDQFARMNVRDTRGSDGSEYEDEGYAPSPQSKSHDRHPQHAHDSLRLQAHTQNHSRSGSAASFNNNTYAANGSRSTSPLQPHRERNGSPQPHMRHQQQPSLSYNGTGHTGASGSSARWNANGSGDSGYQVSDAGRSSTVSLSASRSRSHSSATNFTASPNPNTPPISASNPQTAFVKIKIFNQVADDLIAIRVHPRVSHAELMGKVQTRLGTEVSNLRYRDSMTNTFVGLDTDDELRAWMEATDKHVLFAE